MKPFDEVSIPSDESLVTPLERRLIELEKIRKERRSQGKQETIMQQREYELILRQNIVSDLEDLKQIAGDSKILQSSSEGYVKTLDALIAAGYLPKDVWENHPNLMTDTQKIAMKKLELLRESNERLSLLETALCMPSNEYEQLDGAKCELLQQSRKAELQKLEGEWGVN